MLNMSEVNIQSLISTHGSLLVNPSPPPTVITTNENYNPPPHAEANSSLIGQNSLVRELKHYADYYFANVLWCVGKNYISEGVGVTEKIPTPIFPWERQTRSLFQRITSFGRILPCGFNHSYDFMWSRCCLVFAIMYFLHRILSIRLS